MSKPVVVLVGRPNVGKSTLFNRLTKTRDAIVADMPGLTRDRHYGEGKVGSRPYLVVDTGGFEPVVKEGILYAMAKQTLQAVDESDLIVFVVDGRLGLTPQDKEIAQTLRRSERPVIVAVNKAEGMRHQGITAEFFELGLGDPIAISAAHGEGVRSMIEELFAQLPEEEEPEVAEEEHRDKRIKIAIVGRPNVGKSTLVNTLLGEERVIAFDMPGTTRDSIEIEFERGNKKYTLVDTAGLRRRGKVFEAIEKFSVIKTLQSISDANVVILMLDSQLDISDQDAHIAGFILESGRAVVIAVNKWDGLDGYERDRIKADIARKLGFLSFAKFHYISALYDQGVTTLLGSVNGAYAAAMCKLATPKLTRALQDAVEHQAPPRKGAFRPKMRYAHQGGQNPPIVVVHGNALDAIPESYRRYLEARFRRVFSLDGTPLRIEFRSTDNPYADKS